MTIQQLTHVADELSRHGFAVVQDAIDPSGITSLRVELETALRDMPPYEYPFGDQCRVDSSDPDVRELYPITADVLLAGPVAEACHAYGATAEEHLLVWSREFCRREDVIYGRPHFDRRHQLKVFVYLDDVTQANGATHVLREPPTYFHRRWIAAWRGALDMSGAPDDAVLAQAVATPEHSPVYRSVLCEVANERAQFLALEGSAGTIVFFDTSLAHFGGLVNTGSIRHTVRRHTFL